MNRPLCASVLVLTLFSINVNAKARPAFVSAYAELYPNEPQKCLKCTICHVPNDKTKTRLNRYGKEIDKLLPDPPVKVREIILKAIKEAERFKPKPCTALVADRSGSHNAALMDVTVAVHSAQREMSEDRGKEDRLNSGLPPLRTVRAGLPHTALRLVVLRQRGLTGRGVGALHGKQPPLGEVGVGPAKMIPATSATFPFVTLVQYRRFGCAGRCCG